MVLALHRRFGGAVDRRLSYNDKHRTTFVWRVTGWRARAAIRALLPYLYEKSEQARLILYLGGLPTAYRPIFIRKLLDLKRVEFN